MKTALSPLKRRRRARGAFTLLEVMIGTILMGTMFVSLYVGFTSGFGIIQLARENLRATQILLEKTETLRLLTFDQIKYEMDRTMTVPFEGTNISSGLNYNLTVHPSLQSPVPGTTYEDDVQKVTAEATWMSGGVERRRSMTTYVSRYGLQRYRY